MDDAIRGRRVELNGTSGGNYPYLYSGMKNEAIPWHVAYTAPRAEKKVHEKLEQMGFESYCPLSRTKRKWSDRMKWVYEPVFRSYVFVRISRIDMPRARTISGLLTFLFQEGLPCVVRDAEIETIRLFLREYDGVTSRPVTQDSSDRELPQPGSTVHITSGMLMGQEGTVLRIRNNEVIVRIKSLGQELVASIDPMLLA